MDTHKTVNDLPANYILNSKQAAELLNIKVRTLYNMVNTGRIRPYKLGSGKKPHLRFIKSDVEKILGS